MDGEGLGFLSPNADCLSKIMSPLKVPFEVTTENTHPGRLSYNTHSNSLLSSTLSKNHSLTIENPKAKEDLNPVNGQKFT